MKASHTDVDMDSVRRKLAMRRVFYARAAQVIGAERAFRPTPPRPSRQRFALLLAFVFLTGVLVGYWAGGLPPLTSSGLPMTQPMLSGVHVAPAPGNIGPVFQQRLR